MEKNRRRDAGATNFSSSMAATIPIYSSSCFVAVNSPLQAKRSSQPVKHRKENIEAVRIVGVMQQVVASRWAQPLRQPSAHVHAPVDFFKRKVVDRKTDEHSRGPAAAEIPLQNEERGG